MAMGEMPPQLGCQIGNQLRMAREAAKMDRVKLAGLSGFSQEQIEAWESDDDVAFAGDIAVLCRVLKMSPEWILDVGNCNVGH
ncbi:helix-turn-helix domain-containing protein [Bradyrhizobium sp. BR 1432]|uniref:helix-turn-helix domain-containing protein n=1 Tax=Bradyrhizobium sp. BR 1432 TaxID=3447966 RepID=UPI003EE78559